MKKTSRRKREYFGMTSIEIAIIAIFGVLIMCVSLGSSFVILQAMPASLTLVPAAIIPQTTYTRLLTHTPLPGSTPSPIPTNTPSSTPTETLELPTATLTIKPEVKVCINT
jgi:hypothetical protein